jgi:hypothetical protein
MDLLGSRSELLMPLPLLLLLLLLLPLGCDGSAGGDSGADEEEQFGECEQVDLTQVAVVTEMWFARIEGGVT